jgi:hypothetical protein
LAIDELPHQFEGGGRVWGGVDEVGSKRGEEGFGFGSRVEKDDGAAGFDGERDFGGCAGPHAAGDNGAAGEDVDVVARLSDAGNDEEVGAGRGVIGIFSCAPRVAASITPAARPPVSSTQPSPAMSRPNS